LVDQFGIKLLLAINRC